MSRLSSILILALSLAGGCRRADDHGKLDDTRESPIVPASTIRLPPPLRSSDSVLGDAQIAQIASTANHLEIEAAQMAMEKSKNPAVLAFAKMMVADHWRADDEAKSVLDEADITPQPSLLSDQLVQDSTATSTRLELLSGAEFDRAYIDAQVQAHQQVLDLLDNQLLPSAQNLDLKLLLTAVRPVVQHHLDEAQSLAAKLK